MNRDYDYILQLITGFFRTKDTVKRFQLIEQNSISGWEIWLQIEFANYLSELEVKPEWYREQSYEYDKRKEKLKLKLKPDFLIRKAGWAKDQYMALEFKQDFRALTCFKKMLDDMKKFEKIKLSNSDLRSVWAVGVFHSENEENIEKSIAKYLESLGNPFVYENLTLEKIGESNYWFILL